MSAVTSTATATQPTVTPQLVAELVEAARATGAIADVVCVPMSAFVGEGLPASTFAERLFAVHDAATALGAKCLITQPPHPCDRLTITSAGELARIQADARAERERRARPVDDAGPRARAALRVEA